MKPRIALVILAAALAVPAAHAQSTVYRWVDKDGKVQFTDSPPPTDAKSVTERRMGGGGGSADDATLPYATQQAAKRNPVTLYTSTDCGDLCNSGRNLLAQRGIPFAEKNAQVSPTDAEALQKMAGGLSVPYLSVGGTGVKGYDESSWNSLLDGAGYPRTRLPGQAAPRTEAK